MKGSLPPATITVAASNLAASPTQVNISKPVVTLAANFGTQPGTAFTVGQKVVIQLNLLNNGNIPAKGPYTVQLIASPTTDPAADGAISLTSVETKQLSLKNNVMRSQTFKVTIPSTGIAGVNYNLIAVINAAQVVGISDPNITTVAPQTFTIG